MSKRIAHYRGQRLSKFLEVEGCLDRLDYLQPLRSQQTGGTPKNTLAAREEQIWSTRLGRVPRERSRGAAACVSQGVSPG